jgi:glycerol kinase
MPRDFLLAIDQGTTSTRAVIYDRTLQPVGQGQVEVLPSYPKSGWVEHDPASLIYSIDPVVKSAMREAGVSGEDLAAIGITDQRETTILWDRKTGQAIGPAIVWQDRRTAEFCESHGDRREWIRETTGLVLDPYFSATKIAWLLDHIPNARTRAERGELLAGTVDCFVLWHLTGHRVHATDVTNASRTMLMNLRKPAWSEDLLEFFAVPREILPEIRPSSGVFGTTQGLGYLPDGIPIAGIAGDQQASLVGQGCLSRGQAKCTYGTGAFLLAHTGDTPISSTRGLITTAAANLSDGPPQYALEGSVFVAGAAVQWFRDGLKAVGAAPEIGDLAESADPDSEVIFVPALTGLGAPHWQPDARGTIFGLSRATSLADLARATLEGVAFQVADLIESMEADLPEPLGEIRVDGGMARSDPFLQFQADILGRPIVRSPQTESTALGAAVLAGLGIGIWKPTEVAALLGGSGESFRPKRDEEWRQTSLRRWRKAVETVKGHYRG